MSVNPKDSSQNESRSVDSKSAEAADNPLDNKILIGSQRDTAKPVVQRTPAKPAAAPVAPTPAASTPAAPTADAALATESVGSDATMGGPAVMEATADSNATESSAMAAVMESAPALETAIDEFDIDKELEEALGDLSVDSLMAASPDGDAEIEIDSRVKGTVVRLHGDHVFFSLKGRFEGVTSLRHFEKPPAEGDFIEVRVTGLNEEDGLYEVSLPGAAVAIADWSDLVPGAVIDVRISGSNTGGLECMVNGIRGFIPASQIAIARVEDFGEYVKQKMQCVVVEVNEQRKKLVLSHRAILERENEAKREELLKTLAPGMTVDGIVTKLMDFGAFVDIGGIEGLVHVSKMSWDRVEHPKEIFEPGQKISVKIEKIGESNKKISLSFRDTQENPWTSVEANYPVNSVVHGTVTRLAQFGAFVKLEPGIEGLVHISELAHHRVMAVKNIVNQGDQVEVKVLSVDANAQKLGLSLKATQAKPEKEVKSVDEIPEDVRASAVKKHSEPLKGGHDKPSGGEQFGLNW